jgi:hypothetical protein
MKVYKISNDNEVRLVNFATSKKPQSQKNDFPTSKLIQSGGEMLLYAIHKLIISVRNKEELPDQWKESIIVPARKMGDKTVCNNYRGISLLSTSYKMLSNILLSRLSPHINEIIGDH